MRRVRFRRPGSARRGEPLLAARRSPDPPSPWGRDSLKTSEDCSGRPAIKGALILRIGFWDILYKKKKKQGTTKINSIGNYSGPYITCQARTCPASSAERDYASMQRPGRLSPKL